MILYVLVHVCCAGFGCACKELQALLPWEGLTGLRGAGSPVEMLKASRYIHAQVTVHDFLADICKPIRPCLRSGWKPESPSLFKPVQRLLKCCFDMVEFPAPTASSRKVWFSFSIAASWLMVLSASQNTWRIYLVVSNSHSLQMGATKVGCELCLGCCG